jgi:hypothetical protein
MKADLRLAVVTPCGTPRAATHFERLASVLVPLLRERCEVSVFDPRAGAEHGAAERPLQELEPRAFEQVLWLVANDPACAGTWPHVRAVGGTVALFDWGLGRAAWAALPELAAGGRRAAWVALREGGAEALSAARDGTLRARVEGDGAAAAPARNRAIVRHADCFLVPTEECAGRIRADRNEPTPIAVTPWDLARDAVAVADAWVAALRAFPTHRSARRSVVRTLLANLAGRAAQDRAATAAE